VAKDETPLEAARRYVREGEKHVALQTAIRDELKARGEDTEQVERALEAAIAFLRQAREHLANEAERSGN
jgi:predicted urease superfamily metal-dependent hydrolase